MDSKKTTWTRLILLCFVVIAGMLRLWRLPEVSQFLGDQGRDARIVAEIFRSNDLVFIGPITSIGNMYLGPLYYYFMVPFLWLSFPSPLGPVYALIVLSLATVVALYYLGREIVGEKAGLLAAFLASVSYVLTEFSRFSWNPNPAPLVGLILIWAVHRAQGNKPWYWLIVSFCLSILAQLHYFSLIIGAGAALVWLLELKKLWQAGFPLKLTRTMVVATAASAVLFVASFAPLILFDLKHQGLNSSAFVSLVSQKAFVGGTDEAYQAPAEDSSLEKRVVLNSSPLSIPAKLAFRFRTLFGELLFRYSPVWTTVSALVMLFATMIVWRQRQLTTGPQVLLLAFLVPTLIAGALYRHDLYPHYLLFSVPAVLLLASWLLVKLSQTKAGLGLSLGFVAIFTWYNVERTLTSPSLALSIPTIQAVAETIAQRVKPGEVFNIVSLSQTGDLDGQNYRYFLEAAGVAPVTKERIGETKTLFIIDETHELSDVTSSPVYEVVVFPDKTPRETYQAPGNVTITVLRVEPTLDQN